MPRQRQSTKTEEPAKRKASAPETENDFLEAADEHEKSGGKWRAGDAAKATRFFQRAIDTYNAGLQRYLKSFDLAYNKALLQYQMTQDPRIVAQLGNPVELLRETLDSHRYALRLNEENADILFNTAQVLRSLAETRAEEDDVQSRQDAVSLLQEAIELFSACLSRQEMEYSEQQAAAAEPDNTSADIAPTDNTDAMDTAETSSEPPDAEHYAIVVQPVTPEALLETALAHLSALTTLVNLSTPPTASSLATISELASPLLGTKIPSYLSLISTAPSNNNTEAPPSAFARSVSASEPSSRQTEELPPSLSAALAIAEYTAALADAEYNAGLTTAEDYAARLTDAYEPLVSDSQYQAGGSKPFTSVLCAYSDALSDLASSLAGLDKARRQPKNPSEHATLRWQALSHAQELLTSASNDPLASSAEKARIYLARGDVELGRIQLASLPDASAGLAKSREVLLKNAGVYYRGAAGLARQTSDEELATEATVKEAIVQMQMAPSSSQNSSVWQDLLTKGQNDKVLEIVRDMHEEGLVAEELIKQLV